MAPVQNPNMYLTRPSSVGVTGFEPATASSRTPRIGLQERRSGGAQRTWTSVDAQRSGVVVLRCCTPHKGSSCTQRGIAPFFRRTDRPTVAGAQSARDGPRQQRTLRLRLWTLGQTGLREAQD